jgi:peptidoglycan/xylan/chitin deacetylase (PgdA/CDA1 family)
MNAVLAVLVALPVVLMYHRVDVCAPSDRFSQRLTVSPVQFAAELRSINERGLHTIGLAELALEAKSRMQQLPSDAVLLTFDDGYSDQFRYAFPILQRLGDRATFFINTATVGTPNHLSWSEVEMMSRAGMSIGCHGVNHVDLATLTEEAQRYQIETCMRELSAHLGTGIVAYAYPSGAFDERTIRLERGAGLLFGFTTDRSFQTDPRSPYQITRIRIVGGMSDARFRAALGSTRAFVDLSDSESR